MTTRKKKSPTKKKAASKKRPKPGPKSAEQMLEEATDEELTREMRKTAIVVCRKIQELASTGEDIPTRLLGTFRVCSEWQMDRETVKQGAPDLFEVIDGGKSA